jgi:uncharacterized Fe-S cluster-containing protein
MFNQKLWSPPNKNCGLCGEKTCDELIKMVNNGYKKYGDCPYFVDSDDKIDNALEANYTGVDVFKHNYDFVLKPLPGEVSAHKIVLPFRSDLVERMNIQKGDIVIGRPMGAGCPVPHVLKVFKAEPITGLLYTWVVGPQYSRDKEVKDVQAYHMIGFEGIASHISKELVCGARYTFLPGFCMMNLNHTGLINMILEKSYGFHIRIEDIRILSSI